ncbi:MAG: HEAT repeat domain-containing protein, partial [Anaerolineae bacterium]|nr:HEAT repeat domain-containing protein [Anaerolineae bacterium]
LVALASEEALGALIEALGDSSPLRRAAAAEALGWSQWNEALPALANALSDEDAGVRVAAALAIGRLGTAEGVPLLAARLEQEPLPGVRWAVVRALGMIGTLAAAEPLASCLAREEEPALVRRNAAWALGRLAWDQGVVEGLLAALDDADPLVRWHACSGLEAVVQTLEHVEETDQALLDAIQEALARLEADEARAEAESVGEAATRALEQVRAAARARRGRRLKPA